MANFDIALGLSTAALNTCATQLFAEPAAQTYFNGTQQGIDPKLGSVTFSYSVLAAPVFVLAAPTSADWTAAIKSSGITTMPAPNLFQLQLPSVQGSATIGSSTTPTVAEGPLTVYLTVTQTGTSLKLSPVAVLIDEKAFSSFDTWLVNNILAPLALQKAGAMLSAFNLPAIPAYEGVQLNTPVLTIGQDLLVAAATCTANAQPLDTSDATWPTTACFAVLSPLLLNTLLVGELQPYQNYQHSGSEEKGPSAAWIEGDYNLTVSSVTATVQQDPTKVAVAVTPTVSVSGSFGGYAVAAVCPVGAALSAM